MYTGFFFFKRPVITYAIFMRADARNIQVGEMHHCRFKLLLYSNDSFHLSISSHLP